MMKCMARGLCVGLLLLAGYAGAAPAADEVAPGLKVGDVLDQSNAQLAKDLLPPEILKHYENGDYRNRIVSYPTGNAIGRRRSRSGDREERRDARRRRARHGHRQGHRQATRRTSTAFPFPLIDANDPKAAVKVVWNQFLAYWAGGSSFNKTLVTMLTPKGIDREIVADGWFNFLRRPEREVPPDRTRSTCRASFSA